MRDRRHDVLIVFGIALTTGGSVERVLAWPERVRAVTAEQILEVGRKYLDKNRAATGYLMPPAPPRS